MAKKPTDPDHSTPAPGAGFQPADRMVISTIEQLKAISDPLRVKILELITRKALTVKQLAGRLEEPPTKLYYHVAELEKAGFVTLVDTRVKSGIIEKYYRTSAENITIDNKLLNPAANQENLVPDLLSVIFDTTAREISQSIAAGLVKLQDASEGRKDRFILQRSLYTIREENLPKFIEKFMALSKELNAEEDQDGPNTLHYGLTIAFYPRIIPDSLDED